jgi:hypothetical protein
MKRAGPAGPFGSDLEAVGGLGDTLYGESPPDTGRDTATATLSPDIDGDVLTGVLEGEGAHHVQRHLTGLNPYRV